MTKEIEQVVNQNNARNYGIDLLRIVSMFLVCLIHVLGHGGILGVTSRLSAEYEIAWFLEICAICAVNCFAMVSGYVGVNAKHKVSNLINLWLQVVFYSVLITCGFFVYKQAFSWKMLVKAFFPVTFTQYWYFTAYFILFLFMPLLNCALNKLPEKTLRFSLIAIIIACTVLTIPNRGSLFGLNYGYSALWLMVLYLIGGYVGKYKPFNKIKTKYCVIALFGIVVLTWLSRLSIDLVTKWIYGEAKWGGAFVTYYSPFIVFFSICMLEVFSRIKFTKKPVLIAFMSPLAFGVYLVHSNFIISRYFITNKFADFATYNPILMIFAILGTSVAIYAICSLIDYIRFLIFKALKVKQKLNEAENKIKNKFGKKENV